MGRRVLRRFLRRGSKKGLSRRHLEGRSTPFREYGPFGVCPIYLGAWFPWVGLPLCDLFMLGRLAAPRLLP